MKRALSIRARFAIVSLVSVPVALLLTALFLVALFKADLERRTEDELARHIGQLAASLSFGPDGRLVQPVLAADSRFSEPYSGLYWQIEQASSSTRFRSDSLWDFTLALPEGEAEDGARRRLVLVGPEASELIALERRIIVASPLGARDLRVMAAADRKPIGDASMAFALQTIPYVAGVACFLIGAAFVQMAIGLRPLSRLAGELDRIRERQGGRVQTILPPEFIPVEDAINKLLDARAQAVSLARRRAGDLAHGLKTPLTVLKNNALTLREMGQEAMADEIDHLAGQMWLHTERELMRSRIAANAELRQSNAKPSVIAGEVVRTLRKTPNGLALAWKVEVPEAVEVPVDPFDLRELLGNLLENSCKWARTAVSVEWRADDLMIVEDDGPGVDPEHIRGMTARGVRYDESTPGTGLGLSIVREICDVYGLSLTIENRQTTGLRVCVGFPAGGGA